MSGALGGIVVSSYEFPSEISCIPGHRGDGGYRAGYKR